jgi:hypothetical protein
VTRVVESGVPVSVMNLGSSSTTAIDAALSAINYLRPDPSRGELEQLVSAGNSFYRDVTVELRKRFAGSGGSFGLFANGFAFRVGYTLSRLIDDGVVNTSDALVPGDFRAERARSLLDRRHRFVLSGTFKLQPLRSLGSVSSRGLSNLPLTLLPLVSSILGGLELSPILRVASGAPFNISLGGVDRNLDDVSNDRPNYSGDLHLLRWRAPDRPLDPSVFGSFSLPPIGAAGNLPRNAGRGPGLFVSDLNVTREFRIRPLRLRSSIEFDNVLNKTVFSFGSEFINLTRSSSDFLLPTRTMRPRQIRVGLRVEF